MPEHDIAELAYLAGIIDGEGTIYLRIQSRGSLNLRVSVGNTNAAIIQWLQLHFGGSVTAVPSKNERHKSSWHWDLNGYDSMQLLPEILPFLIIKKAQCELALEAWPAAHGTRGRQPDSNVVKLRRDYVDQMHVLNRKGA